MAAASRKRDCTSNPGGTRSVRYHLPVMTPAITAGKQQHNRRPLFPLTSPRLKVAAYDGLRVVCYPIIGKGSLSWIGLRRA
jgi:hypothetical protein